MNKHLFWVFIPFIMIFGILGYNFVGEKNASLSIIYLAAAVISLLLLTICCFTVKKKKRWIILLFSSVFVVNAGYTFLSASSCLETALWANRISYLGSVFLPFTMLMIILEVTNTCFKKGLPIILFVVAILIFIITASPGISDIYYKEVSFNVVNGTSVLVKVYGPLHCIYLFYLLGYFSAMVAVIIRATLKKTIDSASNAIILAIAVFVNIGVWLIEQLSSIDFEFLSVSYIISELFLLGAHLVMNENERLKDLLKEKEKALVLNNTPQKSNNDISITTESMECFYQGLQKLTPTEKSIYESYLCGASSKDIMTALNIKENTLKFHNKNIYGKLGVTSRKQLLETCKAIKGSIKSGDLKTKFDIKLIDPKNESN